jgi:Helix-hairpin-helix motif
MDATSAGGRSARPPTITFVRDDADRRPRIDLNRATLEQLLPLPGVGKVRGGRIVAARAQRRFSHVDELITRGVLPGSVFARVRSLVQADFMDEPYLTGIGAAGGTPRAATPSVLEVRFEDSAAGVRLIRLNAHSVSHSLDLTREVTREERRRGVIAFELPPMAQGVMNTEAVLYDGTGGRDQYARTLRILPEPGELVITPYPTGGSLRTVNGAPRPTSDGGLLCSAAFDFANGTRTERRLRGRVEWTVTTARPHSTVSGTHDWGREIVVPAEGTSTGWFLDIRLSGSSAAARCLRDGKVVVIRYRFRETGGAIHDVSMRWRVVRGPHLNVIYVGAERFGEDDRQLVRDSVEVARSIYAQRDLGIGRVLEYAIPAAEAGRYVVVNDNGEARDLTNHWTVDNDGIDLFIVDVYEGSVVGYSPIRGPCEKNENWWQIKDMTGTVVELYTTVPALLGSTIGHELGHYLGLSHVHSPWTPNARMNLMFPVASTSRNQLTANQADEMRDHCFMKNLG